MTRIRKLMFGEVLLALNQRRVIKEENVHYKTLERFVWVVSYGLGEMKIYHKSREAAVEYAICMTGDEMPKGIKTALMRDGIFQYNSNSCGIINITITKRRLCGLLKEHQC